MDKSISILLGSGFSAPMGYPTGKNLNELLANCTVDDFAFDSAGRIVVSNDGSRPDFGYKNQYDLAFDFWRSIAVHFRKEKSSFDYEEFYDYLSQIQKTPAPFDSILKSTMGADWSFEQALYTVRDTIYPQLVAYYLKDKDGKRYYDNAGHFGFPIFPGYTGILGCLMQLSKNYILNVHTLNHDLFFERLDHTDWLNGKVCDGFEELGSPFFGEHDCQSGAFKVRLQRYTGKYDKQIKLFKLHGSLDYVIFFERQGQLWATPSNYLKTRQGVNISLLYKEKKNDKGKFDYDVCISNYHSDFLIGTTSKIVRYQEPVLYKKLFELFRENLKEAESLLIIGYGGRDSEINKMLLENFDFRNKKSVIIDPHPGTEVKSLAKSLNAKIINTSLENIRMEEIGIG